VTPETVQVGLAASETNNEAVRAVPQGRNDQLFEHVTPLRTRARALCLLASSGLIALALSACGTSSPASSSSLSAKQQGCTAVSDVLADGPDPDVDSVGYAEAQVLPLRQLKLADATLAHVVDQLDAAYKSFSSSNGTKGTSAAMKVSAAEKAVNAICPNAAP
jgi:hypothetical protein